MASVYKTKLNKSKGRAGRWTCCYIDETGVRRNQIGFTDRAESMRLANHLEEQARKVKFGLAEPGEQERRKAASEAIGRHLDDYRKILLAKGNTARHCRHLTGAIKRLLALAKIAKATEISPDRIQAALGEMRKTKSPRTCNHALKALKAFTVWLDEANRIPRVPRGLMSIPVYNERVDRKRVRRSATKEEIDKLLAAAESGKPIVAKRMCRGGRPVAWITGPQRAMLYRLALATGFRANELRALDRSSFHLDGDNPCVALRAEDAKNRKEVAQPITREFAAWFAAHLRATPEDEPLVVIPEKTAAMLRVDLKAAGIEEKDDRKRVLDFHALRVSYVTHLAKTCSNPKIVQTLARHSSITLTMDVYAKVEDDEVRKALEKQEDR